ncbi:endospore germination permease [Paenibacillus sp. NPDC056579]|uniref:GerAB/ArcD/ProY family transporter n=1 Tax=Paenibacillus sp. NPDC056579 TaxID=3345871 RepID=UPI0036A37705
MLEKGKIGVHQFTVLAILFTLGSSLLISPSGLAFAAKQDAWIAAIFGLAGGLLLIPLYYRFAILFPQKTLVQYSQELLGRWPGRAVVLLYFIFFFTLGALVLRNIGDFITAQVLPNTPLQFIHVFFLAVIIFGVRHGIETFTRSGEIFLPWVSFFFLFMVVLLPTQTHMDQIRPILGYGLKPVLQATVPLIGTPYLELVVFLMILPCVNQSRKTAKAFATGVAIGGMGLIMISLLSILVLGADLTARHIYPSFTLAKKISVGNFLERVEVIMAGIWFITIYFKLSICFYAATMTFAELFRLKEARPLYLPFGMIMVVYSIVAYPNSAYFLNFATKIWVWFSATFGLLIPLLLLAAARLRKIVPPK